MLLGRILVALALQHFKRGDETAASLARKNHGIDVAALSRDIRVGKLLAKFVNFLCPCLSQQLLLALFAQRAFAASASATT